MQYITIILAFLTLPLGLLAQEPIKLAETEFTPLDRKKTLTTIAFGSCNRQDKAQPLWSEIAKQNPDLWVWLGDNIYADTENMNSMKASYDQQNKKEGYAALKQKTPIIGIWDDHDYGVNDGGARYPKKAESRDLLFQFLHVNENNPAWKREGAYQSYVVGEEGKTVKFILLDGRYFRGRLLKGNQEYMAYPHGDMLGEAQWAWLEAELKENNADFTVIACGIQMIPDEHRWEKWANFPTSRDRLFQLLRKYRPRGLVLLSGDRHHGEISRMKLSDEQPVLHEITASSLNVPISANKEEANKYRIGKVITAVNYGKMSIDWGLKPDDIAEMTIELKGEDGKVFEKISVKAE